MRAKRTAKATIKEVKAEIKKNEKARRREERKMAKNVETIRDLEDKKIKLKSEIKESGKKIKKANGLAYQLILLFISTWS